MKKLIFMLTVVLSYKSYALCGNSQIVIGVNISDATSDLAYMEEQAPFRAEDRVEIYEIKTQQSVYLTQGILEDDNAGNYSVEASNSDGQSIYFTHDHETWHTDGLYGEYISTTGEHIDLETIKCSYDDLF